MIEQALAIALEASEPIRAERVEDWWPAYRSILREAASPFEAAVIGGARADRLGFAFAAGYECALASLLPSRDRSRAAALCATEKGGAHPKAIATEITTSGALRGEKIFVTLAHHAEDLFVLAKRGATPGDRSDLVFVCTRRDAPGVRLSPLAPTPFAPEIPHASVIFDDVRGFELLPGDGWNDYVRPFRTVEDLHVHAAVIAFLISLGRRHGFAAASIERACALLASIAGLSSWDPSRATTHVALAGAIDLARAWIRELDPYWERAPAEDRARWERDRPLLDIAGKVRVMRTEKAWAELAR
jgi:acyl-CoA dehydrogenase